MDTILILFWSQGAHPPTKSYKILQNDHATSIVPQSHTKLPENAISLTISNFFYFHGLKCIFINISMKQKYYYLIDISDSRHITMIISFIHLSKNVLIIFYTPMYIHLDAQLDNHFEFKIQRRSWLVSTISQ